MIFTSVSPSPFSRAVILLGPFPKWPAFAASQYYGPSAPSRPDRQAMRPPGPVRRWRRRRSGGAGTVPTFIREPFDGIGTQLCPCTIATTTPQAFTVASPTSDFTQPRSSPTAPRGHRVRGAIRPMSARFRVGGSVLRSVQPLVPRVCLSVSLAEPAPSGSTGTTRRCRGLLHQPPPCRGDRPSSSFCTPAATGVQRWPPTTARVRERIVALEIDHPQLVRSLRRELPLHQIPRPGRRPIRLRGPDLGAADHAA